MKQTTHHFHSSVLYTLGILCALLASCKKGETYADMKNKEKDAINRFLTTRSINVIDEATFKEQGQTTRTENNQFVLFEDDGIYMQIVRKGQGQTMVEMAKEQADSTISKVILCRFFEYDIENADTTCQNIHRSGIVDKMLCTYAHRGRSYTASFTEGIMRTTYSSSTVVPKGWLKPLDYIRMAKSAGTGEIAKVRLIVPHSSGTANAGTYVLPFYYEITYQLGK
ncbi:MAG: DUF4827 domain-containing protein [Bacteroidaceae bacterium]|nr:DUF4827 domain-containing protein [Bacteroidaceae bacterium]MBQ9639999.1 DUF4827 domain-containing protein [Bacteroidaceae bacterium]